VLKWITLARSRHLLARIGLAHHPTPPIFTPKSSLKLYVSGRIVYTHTALFRFIRTL
jgi:hypothetical protein